MAEVNLNIHGRSYGVACDDGQEQRVLEVGNYVDSRVRDIASAGAASNETHLLVLTALVLADEVKELRDEMASLQQHVAMLSQQQQQMASAPSEGFVDEEKGQVIDFLNHFSTRIEALADRFDKTG